MHGPCSTTSGIVTLSATLRDPWGGQSTLALVLLFRSVYCPRGFCTEPLDSIVLWVHTGGMTTNTVQQSKTEEIYIFRGLNGMVYAEMFLADGTHLVAPTPYGDLQDAVGHVAELNPSAYVDWLDDDSVPRETRRMELGHVPCVECAAGRARQL